MAVLLPDEKGLVLVNKKIFLSSTNAADYHSGPVAPCTADGISFQVILAVFLMAISLRRGVSLLDLTGKNRCNVWLEILPMGAIEVRRV